MCALLTVIGFLLALDAYYVGSVIGICAGIVLGMVGCMCVLAQAKPPPPPPDDGW